MIWHFLEVWLLIAVSFAAGCALGALLYGLLADSPLALAQGAVADAIGDVLDWAKVRLGVGPAWRNDLARSVSRPGPTPPPERIEPPRFDDEPSRPLDPGVCCDATEWLESTRPSCAGLYCNRHIVVHERRIRFQPDMSRPGTTARAKTHDNRFSCGSRVEGDLQEDAAVTIRRFE